MNEVVFTSDQVTPMDKQNMATKNKITFVGVDYQISGDQKIQSNQLCLSFLISIDCLTNFYQENKDVTNSIKICTV